MIRRAAWHAGRAALWLLRVLMALAAALVDLAAVTVGTLLVIAVTTGLLLMAWLLGMGWALWPSAFGSPWRLVWGGDEAEPAKPVDSAPAGVATPAVADVVEAMNSLSLAELNEANRQALARPGIRRQMPWPDPPAKGTH